MQHGKHQRIEEILHSLDGIRPAEPAGDLWAGVENAIEHSKKQYISPKKVYLALAVAAILLSVNVYIVFTQSETLKKNDQAQSMYELVKQYELASPTPDYNYP